MDPIRRALFPFTALAIIAAVVGLALDVGRPETASADHGNFITIDVEAPDGGEFDFTVDGTNCSDTSFTLSDGDSRTFDCDEGDVDVSVAVPAGQALSAAPTCEVATEGEGTTPGVDSDWTPAASGDIDFDLTDNEHVLCAYVFEASGGVFTITKDAPDADGEDFDFEITGVGTDCDDNFVLSDGESAVYVCPIDGTFTVTETDVPDGWELTGISCTDIDINSDDIVVDTDDSSVEVTFRDDGESIDCTFSNAPVATATPTATGTATVTATATSTGTVAPTNTPVAPTATPGSVTPPNTGSGGLANGGSGSWALYIAVMVIVSIPAGYLLVTKGNTTRQ